MGTTGTKPGEEPIGKPKRLRSAFPSLTDPVTRASTQLFEENLRRGAKPKSDWVCGLEFELFGYESSTLQRIAPAQVQKVLAGFAPSSNDLVYEGNVLIEVGAGKMGRITVEPGGQIEFSGWPQRSLRDVEHHLLRFLLRLSELAEANDLVFIAAGFDPLRTLEEQRWFPKQRYGAMRPYLRGRGSRAWDMMSRTCAIQCNLDYGSEEDLAKKFLLGNRLAPIVTAIFANSPFENGRPSGYKSTRAAAWLYTDRDRTGISPPAIGDGFSAAQFVDYALQVPMIFAQREGAYLTEPAGMRFGEFLEGTCDGIQPVFGDWADHLTTLFTEARLKQHVELRSGDAGGVSMALAYQALWKGLLYDSDARDEALRIAPNLNAAESRELQEDVATNGLAALDLVNVCDLAKELVVLGRDGLNRINPDEASYLDVLDEQVIDEEICPSDVLLKNWEGSWHGSIYRAFDYLQVT